VAISLALRLFSRLNRELERFDYDSALAYPEQQLLFTFNPHRLVLRDEARSRCEACARFGRTD
jgi:hypothetical protein